MALPCPPRRVKPWYSIQFRGAAKMAATVSANSSAVLWVYVHFDGWIIAWQGPRRRERLSQGVIDNSAPLVSHDISYGTRLGDVTIAVHTAGFIGCHRDPPRFPVAATMTRQSSRRSRIAPHLPRHSDAWYRFHPCEHHVRAFPVPRTRSLRKRAGRGSMSAPLDVTCWQRLSPVPHDVTDNNDASGPAASQSTVVAPCSDPGLISTYLCNRSLAGFVVPIKIVGTLHLSRNFK